MKRNFKSSVVILLSLLIGSNVVFSQTNFWERTNAPNDYTHSITIADNGDIWIGSRGVLYLSTDNGDNWVRKNTSRSTSYYFTSIGINPVNGYIFVGNNIGEVLRSTNNGDDWVSILDNKIFDILFTKFGEIYVGASGGVYYSTDMGNTWQNKSNGLLNGSVGCLILGTDGTLYAGTSGGVYRSTNGGDSWQSPLNYTDARIYGLTISGDGSIFATAYSNGVLKSTDGGMTWNQVNTGLSSNYNAYRISYSPKVGYIFVSGVNSNDVVYRSTDFGANWYQVHNGLPSATNKIATLVCNPTTGIMFIGYSDIRASVYRSTQHTVNIVSIDAVPTSIDFSTIQTGSYIDSTIYITNTGTTDVVITGVNIKGTDASSFLHIFTGAVTLKPNETQRLSVVFRPYTSGTRTATMEIITDVGSAGIITLSGNATSGAISVEEPNGVLGDGSTFLFQNSPNPIRSGYDATIRYRLNIAGTVNLIVYDLLGKEVAKLVDEYKSKGIHSINFNTKNLPSGVYFYKLRTHEYEGLQKMLIVR